MIGKKNVILASLQISPQNMDNSFPRNPQTSILVLSPMSRQLSCPPHVDLENLLTAQMGLTVVIIPYNSHLCQTLCQKAIMLYHFQ